MTMLMLLSFAPPALADNHTNETETTPEQILISAGEDAENDTTEVEVEIEEEFGLEDLNLTEEELPTTTPDKPIRWGLKRALERIDLALTFNKAEKAKKGLKHARERLLEVEAMVAEKKLDAAEKARDAHDRTMLRVKERIKEFEAEPDKELEDELELESELEEHENNAELLKLKIRIKGELTEGQQARLDALLESFRERSGEIRVELKAKKERTKIKIKARTEKTDEEIEELIEKIEERLKIREKREQRIETLTRVIEKLEEKGEIKGLNRSKVIERLKEVRESFDGKFERRIRVEEKDGETRVRIRERDGDSEIEVEIRVRDGEIEKRVRVRDRGDEENDSGSSDDDKSDE